MLYPRLTGPEGRLLARLLVLRRVPHTPVEGVALVRRVTRDLERYEPRLLEFLHLGRPVGLTTILHNLVRDGLVEVSPAAPLRYQRTVAADELEAGLVTMRPRVLEALDEFRLDPRELLDALAGE